MTEKKLNKIKKRITPGCKQIVIKLENKEAEKYERNSDPSSLFEKFISKICPQYMRKIVGKKYTRYILDYRRF